ncbi:MAG: phosphatidate cytidylyltransferase [Helicobacteraceae bacterium]|nr:phosphatidate cytidylyltransferase [Helicobacteraceae bacterium]
MEFLDKIGVARERVTTAIALIIPVIIIGLIDNFFIMWLVFGAIYLIAFYEATKLFKIEDNSLFAYAALLWVVAAFYPYGDDLFVLAGVGYASLVAYHRTLTWKSFLPFIYPTAGMLFLFTMYQEYGVISLVWLLVVVAGTDIGAYFVGKNFGKTMFCETSPNKTLEGVVGGVVVATLLGFSIGLIYVDLSQAIIISLLTAIASVFGDLFESYLKREADVKDSGNILPGHGGILDRIDGYLFGVIVMLVLLRGLV